MRENICLGTRADGTPYSKPARRFSNYCGDHQLKTVDPPNSKVSSGVDYGMATPPPQRFDFKPKF